MREELPGGESVLESVRAFFLECPLLDGAAVFSTGRPDRLPPGYAVCGVRGDGEALRRYLDGGSLRRMPFDFCSSEPHGCDARRIRAARRFFDALENWIMRQDCARNFPRLSRGRVCVRLEAAGYPRFEHYGEGSALWSMRCRLLYRQPPGMNASEPSAPPNLQ